MISLIAGHFNYLAVVIVMMAGLFIVFAGRNLIRRIVGLAIFQASAGLLYITIGKVTGGTAAIMIDAGSQEGRVLASRLDPVYLAANGVNGVVYSNPLPHVLILTAIVVGVATLAVGLAIAIRVREAFGTVEADEIERMVHLETIQGRSQP